jgi:chemotaxis protein histidine kinase CheA
LLQARHKSLHGGTYVLPAEIVLDAFAAERKEVSTVGGGKGRVLVRRNEVLPVCGLDERLNGVEPDRTAAPGPCDEDPSTFPSPGTFKDRSKGYDASALNMLLVCTAESRCILEVGTIVGVQKVVVKSIDGLQTQGWTFGGAAIMGDGSVAMIITKDGLDNLIAG